MEAWLHENGFRLQVVYRKGGAYDAAARDIEGKLAQRFDAAGTVLGPRLTQLMRDHYAVHEITDTARIGHMDVLSGDDAFQKALETLPGGEPAPRRADPARAPEQRAAAPRGARRAGARAAGLLRRQPGGQPPARPPAGAGRAPTLRRRRRPRRSRSRSAGTRPSRRRSTSRTRSRAIPSTGRRRSSSTARAPAPATARSRSTWSRTPSTTIKVVPTPASKDLDYYETGDGHAQEGGRRRLRRQARLQPREPVLHRRELGGGRHRPRQGAQGQVGRPCSARR